MSKQRYVGQLTAIRALRKNEREYVFNVLMSLTTSLESALTKTESKEAASLIQDALDSIARMEGFLEELQ